MPQVRAFTLIELLIVVAIIGVLAAIAVPNFLNAQMRSMVARVKADQRGYATAMEAYFLDQNGYPLERDCGCTYIQYCTELTTPIAYISTVHIPDPFKQEPSQYAQGCRDDWAGTYHYVNYDGIWGHCVYGGRFNPKAYVIMSYGPDRYQNGAEHFPYCYNFNSNVKQCWDLIYSSSNGLRSSGDIARTGGNAQAPLVMGG